MSVNVAAGSKVTFELTYEELLKRHKGKYEMYIKVQPKQLVRHFEVISHPFIPAWNYREPREGQCTGGGGRRGVTLRAEPRMHLQVLVPVLGQRVWNGFSSTATGSQGEEAGALEDCVAKRFWNTCNRSMLPTSRLKGKANTMAVSQTSAMISPSFGHFRSMHTSSSLRASACWMLRPPSSPMTSWEVPSPSPSQGKRWCRYRWGLGCRE